MYGYLLLPYQKLYTDSPFFQLFIYRSFGHDSYALTICKLHCLEQYVGIPPILIQKDAMYKGDAGMPCLYTAIPTPCASWHYHPYILHFTP